MDSKIFKKILSDEPSEDEYGYWKKMMKIYMEKAQVPDNDKREVLFVLCGQKAFSLIEDCSDFETAIIRLDKKFTKRSSAVMMRHKLRNHRQLEGHSIENFLSDLQAMAKRCPIKALTAEQHRDQLISDAFVSGLQSPSIRQRLLESSEDNLSDLVKTALTMELAIEDAKGLSQSSHITNPTLAVSASSSSSKSCYWCGGIIHSKNKCPARNSVCRQCGRKGHWQKVCNSRKKPFNNHVAGLQDTRAENECDSSCASLFQLAALNNPCNLIPILVDGHATEALLDTGADKTFISADFALQNSIVFDRRNSGTVRLADNSRLKLLGSHTAEIQWDGRIYASKATIAKNLVAPVILGLDILGQHKAITMKFQGQMPPISVCLALKEIKCEPLSLAPGTDFSQIKPIVTRSRPNTKNQPFVTKEINRMLSEGVITKSRSPWRAQSFVVQRNNKQRLVIDYSSTINRFTPLDAYPTPNIEDLLVKVGANSFFSKIDLREAYHQVPLRSDEFYLTAFEANGQLYEFQRLPFGCSNAVPIFQRTIDTFISENRLRNTHAYLDDIVICGKTQEEHDENLRRFEIAAKKAGLQFNPIKSTFNTQQIDFLGHLIEKGTLKPDPSRYEPLLALPNPRSIKELNHIIGLFAYYSKWIPNCSEITAPLYKNRETFEKCGLSTEAKHAIESLKTELVNACLAAPDLRTPFLVETDASGIALGGVLSQEGRPVAFFSRVLQPSERRQSVVEREACAIVDCCKRWRHLLRAAPHCTLLTDQRSVSFLFNKRNASKIKNEKLMRWRLEISDINIDISYRPGSQNTAADSLSRCVSLQSDTLKDIHDRLCHPGITRMMHYCRSHNLPYSLSEIRQMIGACSVCAELKPKFHRPPKSSLIRATCPWERLSIDFIGPLSDCQGHRYILTVVDEYSRFPFAFPCKDISTQTLISELCGLFTLFGCPRAIHSDRGAQFESAAFRKFLLDNGIVKTRTSPYRPAANGQCERFNGIICKAVSLALRSKNLPKTKWIDVLPLALSSIRGLLCTAINCTPHERLFKFSRGSKFGCDIPDFLLLPGSTVLHRLHVRGKGDPLTEKVQLLETLSPHFARVEYPSGRTTTVSTSNLAPFPVESATNDEDIASYQPDATFTNDEQPAATIEPLQTINVADDRPMNTTVDEQPTENTPEAGKRGRSRIIKKPSYLKDYYCGNSSGGED